MHVNSRVISSIFALALSAGCAGSGLQQAAIPQSDHAMRAAGSATTIKNSVPAYFNGQLFSILIIPKSPNAAAQILAKNKNLNKIYVDISFNNGVTPFQFTSAAQILSRNQITLTPTNQVVVIPVVGPKK